MLPCQTAKEVYKVEHAKIVEVDTQGCCSGELDSQADGISSIQRACAIWVLTACRAAVIIAGSLVLPMGW
eukprot:SAG25_NODE_5505_length_651_cov_1.019928_2_plen_70_part_00